MTRDNILFTVCGFVLGLVAGALALGPYLYNKGITSRPLVAAPPVTAPPAAAAPGGDPAVMQNVMQRVAALKASLQKNPDDPDAATELANLYMDAHKYPQAIGYYEMALAHHDNPDVATDLGICYRATGDYTRALATFDSIQQKHPGHWASLFNKAVVLVDLKRLPEARGIVDELKKQRPDDPDVQTFDRTLRQIEK